MKYYILPPLGLFLLIVQLTHTETYDGYFAGRSDYIITGYNLYKSDDDAATCATLCTADPHCLVFVVCAGATCEWSCLHKYTNQGIQTDPTTSHTLYIKAQTFTTTKNDINTLEDYGAPGIDITGHQYYLFEVKSSDQVMVTFLEIRNAQVNHYAGRFEDGFIQISAFGSSSKYVDGITVMRPSSQFTPFWLTWENGKLDCGWGTDFRRHSPLLSLSLNIQHQIKFVMFSAKAEAIFNIPIEKPVVNKQLNELCYGSPIVCALKSECVEDKEGIKRCLCKSGNIELPEENKCHTVLTVSDDPNCAGCRHDSICYDVDDDNTMDGCICSFGFHGDRCEITELHINRLCDDQPDSTKCADFNAECRPEIGFPSVKRCVCKAGFVAVQEKYFQRCYSQLNTKIDSDCESCTSNNGICYDSNTDSKRDGCKCPYFQTGDDCEVYHLHMQCLSSPQLMKVCYTPHPQVIFDDGWIMYVEDHLNQGECRATIVDSEDDPDGCKLGDAKFKLPISSSTCGIKTMQLYPILKYYYTFKVENAIVTDSSLRMDLYCEYILGVDVRTDIGLSGSPGSDQGIVSKPNLSFEIFDHLGRMVESSNAMQVGDAITLLIGLSEDDVYGAFRVLFCMASSSHIIPHPEADTLPLIKDSCPADDQYAVTNDNIFNNVNGNVFKQKMSVKVFKFRTFDVVFFHITAKLCLKGKENDCAIVGCGRKKRETEDEGYNHTTITYSVRIIQSNGRSTNSGNGVTATGMMLIALFCWSLMSSVWLL